MKSSKKSPREQNAAQCKKMRFMTTVTGAFENGKTTLLILRFDDAGTPPETKEAYLKNLIARAKTRGCVKYVIAREYGETGNLDAFHIYTDLDTAAGEAVCRRWNLGSYEVQAVEDVFATALFSRIWEQTTTPKNRFLFSPCAGIWEKARARAEQQGRHLPNEQTV